MTEHDWQIMRNRWARGIDWCVLKRGSKWAIAETFGKDWPLFRTKRAAGEALDKFILQISHERSRPTEARNA